MRPLELPPVEELFAALQPYCTAIYLGGSCVQPYLRNPHDIDIICFARNKHDVSILRAKLAQGLRKQTDYKTARHFVYNGVDYSQVRSVDDQLHNYFAYLPHYMQLLVGEPRDFEFDLLQLKDQRLYIQLIHNFLTRPIAEKHGYHIYRGFKIIEHGSYDLTDEEIDIINGLHDCDEEHGVERQKAKEGCRNFTHIKR